MKIVIRKTLNGWEPADDDAKSYHKQGKLGDYYHTDVSRFNNQRNARLNAKYWCMLQVCVDNQNQFINKEQLHIRIKRVLEIVELIYNPITQAFDYEVGSTAFEKMDETTFQKYYNDALTFCCRYVISGSDEHEVDAHVERLLGFA